MKTKIYMLTARRPTCASVNIKAFATEAEALAIFAETATWQTDTESLFTDLQNTPEASIRDYEAMDISRQIACPYSYRALSFGYGPEHLQITPLLFDTETEAGLEMLVINAIAAAEETKKVDIVCG